MFAANWIVLEREIDLAADYRGTYDTADACAALLEREGGLVEIIGKAAAAHGLAATDDPVAGDIGVVITPTIRLGNQQFETAATTAISRGHGNWAVLIERGLGVAPLTALASWKI